MSEDSDADLIAAAEAAGMERGTELAGMALQSVPEMPRIVEGVELLKVVDAATAVAYADVQRALRIEQGLIPEAVNHIASPEALLSPRVNAYVALLNGTPAAAAMCFSTERTAGLYWVATKTEARNRGLGGLVSTAAVRAGFDDGAEAVTLQATVMGEPVYRRLGFEKFTTYVRYI